MISKPTLNQVSGWNLSMFVATFNCFSVCWYGHVYKLFVNIDVGIYEKLLNVSFHSSFYNVGIIFFIQIKFEMYCCCILTPIRAYKSEKICVICDVYCAVTKDCVNRGFITRRCMNLGFVKRNHANWGFVTKKLHDSRIRC